MNPSGTLHTDINLLKRDQIGVEFLNHFGEPLYVVDTIHSLTVVNVVAENTKSGRGFRLLIIGGEEICSEGKREGEK